MAATTIKQALAGKGADGTVTVQGWVRTRRDSKAGLSFVNVSDGSCFDPIQVVAPKSLANYDSEVAHLTAGCAVSATGTLVASQGKGQGFEIQADSIDVLGWVDDPETYPIQPKPHSMEFLREVAHLRPRTNVFGAITRVRHTLAQAVHRSRLVNEDCVYLVDLLRAQLKADGHYGSLHPIHRLDRGTSGVLLVGRNPQVAAALGEQFMSRDVEKTYLAVCRGWPDESGEIDYPLPGVRETSERKPALTRWKRLATVEVPIAISRYPQQRYALIEVQPETGRYRQIRRHFSHIHHHLIGDTSHGRGDHNRLFREHYGVHRMLLHAHRLRFAHPISGEVLTIEAPVDMVWMGLMERFGWGDCSLITRPYNHPCSDT